MREVPRIPVPEVAPDEFYDKLFDGNAYEMSQKEVGPDYKNFRNRTYHAARKRGLAVTIRKLWKNDKERVYVQAMKVEG